MSNRSDALYLAIDQGGHASRALLFDVSGQVVASAFAPLDTRHPREGWVEHDAKSMIESVQLAIRDVLSEVEDVARIRAAGLATQRSSIVCWDRRTGEPLSPVLSWQDRRNAAWLERQRLEPDELRNITGLVPSPHYGASKLRWCLDHLEAVRLASERKTLALGPVAGFLLFRLLAGRPFVIDPANASRTLLWDYRSRDWSASLLEQFGLPRPILPDCVGSRHAFGHLPVAGASIPLTVCTGDQSAVPFAFGPPGAGAAYINIGTGAFVQRLIGRAPPATRGLLVSVAWQHAAEAIYVLEGTVNGAGSALDAIGCAQPASASKARDDTELLFLNGVGGLGSPFWLPEFESRFIGDGDATARQGAVLESIAFLLRENLDLMQELSGRLEWLIVTGGIASRDELCRAIAGLSGVSVRRPELREATARGLAWLVADRPSGWEVPMEEFAPARDAGLRSRFARWRKAMRSAIRKSGHRVSGRRSSS
ncbi:MAG: FGGY family carbohydrate kinase [Gammaproteobacteria bacterium]